MSDLDTAESQAEEIAAAIPPTPEEAAAELDAELDAQGLDWDGRPRRKPAEDAEGEGEQGTEGKAPEAEAEGESEGEGEGEQKDDGEKDSEAERKKHNASMARQRTKIYEREVRLERQQAELAQAQQEFAKHRERLESYESGSEAEAIKRMASARGVDPRDLIRSAVKGLAGYSDDVEQVKRELQAEREARERAEQERQRAAEEAERERVVTEWQRDAIGQLTASAAELPYLAADAEVDPSGVAAEAFDVLERYYQKTGQTASVPEVLKYLNNLREERFSRYASRSSRASESETSASDSRAASASGVQVSEPSRKRRTVTNADAAQANRMNDDARPYEDEESRYARLGQLVIPDDEVGLTG